VIGHLGSLRDTHPCRVTHHRNKTLFSPRYDCIPFAIHTRAHTHTHTHTHTHMYTLGTEFTLRDDMIYCVRSTEATQLRPRATVVSRTAAARQERKVRGVLASCGDPVVTIAFLTRVSRMTIALLSFSHRSPRNAIHPREWEFVSYTVYCRHSTEQTRFFCARSAYDNLARGAISPHRGRTHGYLARRAGLNPSVPRAPLSAAVSSTRVKERKRG